MSPRWEIAQAAIDRKLDQLRAGLQEQISRLIAAFGEEELLLSHERNLLAPTSQLPPEILSKIFLASLDISPTSQQSQEREKSDSLTLCHVSQYWRTLILNNPRLWCHIQVRGKTKPSLVLEYARVNAKQFPITLDIDYARGLHETECVSKLLYAGAGQLQSLALTATAWTLQRDSDLLQKDAEPAVLLESLQLMVDRIATPLTMNPFPSGAPNLRCLESSGVYIPWNAPILKSSRLTHLVLHHTPELSASTMADFVSFLGRSPQLKTLLVGLRWNCRTSELEDILRDVALPVELPNIEVLHLLSKCFNPLSLIMDAIRILHDGLDSIKVLCGETKDESSLRAICNFLHSYQRDRRFSPDHIDISWNGRGDMHGFPSAKLLSN